MRRPLTIVITTYIPWHYNNNNMFISYSWYNNEMVQIQMENMPKNYNTHASYMSSAQWRGYVFTCPSNNMHIWYHSSAILNNMQFPQSDQTFRMNQILASDHHFLYMLWALLSLVLDHLFQYQQCWQCFRTDNHRCNSIAGWCILHSHQLCPSYGGHCKCWCCW